MLSHGRVVITDRLHALMPVGFYYKTFITPRFAWETAENHDHVHAGAGRHGDFHRVDDADLPAPPSYANKFPQHTIGVALLHESAGHGYVKPVLGKREIFRVTLLKLDGRGDAILAGQELRFTKQVTIDIRTHDRILALRVLR